MWPEAVDKWEDALKRGYVRLTKTFSKTEDLWEWGESFLGQDFKKAYDNFRFRYPETIQHRISQDLNINNFVNPVRERATGDASPYRLSSPIQKRAIDALAQCSINLLIKNITLFSKEFLRLASIGGVVYDKQVCVLYLAKLVQDIGQAIKDRFYKEEEAALAAATTDE